MSDIIVVVTNNKKYIKIDKYKVLLAKKNSNKSTESVEYKERLIKYEKNYEKFNSYQD